MENLQHGEKTKAASFLTSTTVIQTNFVRTAVSIVIGMEQESADVLLTSLQDPAKQLNTIQIRSV